MPPPPPVSPVWHFDAAGWTNLGTQTVNGSKDTDSIAVGRYEGKFDQIVVVVEDSDVELNELTILFGNGEKWSPNVKHVFREGQRSRVIDLPGNNRVIQKIVLKYANIPGGGRATVGVYGRDKNRSNTGVVPPPASPPPPPAYHFDAKGWTMLGDKTVNGRGDRDTIRVRGNGAFDQLTLVVTGSDLELKDLSLVFGNGETWSPKVAHTFREGQRTRVIDLPGKDRHIAKVNLVYGNLPGGGNAHVEVYARDVGRPAPPPITKVTWENKGWTYLGKSTADGWKDRDRMVVGNKGPFSEIMFVVAGSDVELNGVVVTLGNGERFEMKGSIAFKEGTRTRPIDIPGALRKIKSVDFAYTNLPGGGRATVEVWARAKPQAGTPSAPPAPPTATPPVVRDHR